MFTADEGYYFGLGAFETIAVEEGKPVFLEEHYQRLLQALNCRWILKKFSKRCRKPLGKSR